MNKPPSPPRKILYICPNSVIAGAEQVTYLILKHHDLSHWIPEIYFLKENGQLVDAVRKLGITFHSYSQRKFRLRLRNPLSVALEIKNISKVIQSSHISLIHSVMGYGQIFGGIASKLTGIPNLWFQHGPVGKLDRWVGKIRSELILTNSNYTLERQKALHPKTRELKIIPLGTEILEPKDWTQGSLQYRKPFSPNTLIFGLVGRIAPLKGHLLLIQAVKDWIKTSKEPLNIGFLIIGDVFSTGDSEYLAEVKNEIQRFHLNPYFYFTGHLSEVYPALSACDVILNCSISPEGFGMTLIEAMMLGKPVIAPRIGGPQEIVVHEENGLFFEPGNANDLSNQMAKLYLDPEQRNHMGETGRNFAIHRFSARRMASEIEAAYERVLESTTKLSK